MKTWVKVVLVLVAVAVGVGGLLFWESNRLAAMTVAAEAIVTKATLDEDEESSSLDSTRVEYDFAIAGAPRKGTDSLPGDKVADYPAGRKVSICYNPEDPRQTSIRTGPTPCGG